MAVLFRYIEHSGYACVSNLVLSLHGRRDHRSDVWNTGSLVKDAGSFSRAEKRMEIQHPAVTVKTIRGKVTP